MKDALTGGMVIALLVGAPIVAVLCWPEQASRGLRCAVGEGQVVTATFAPPAPAAIGTPVRRDGRVVGWVARDHGRGRVDIRLVEPGPVVPLVRRNNPGGLLWALEELVTPEVVARAVEQATAARVGDSMKAVTERLGKKLEARFPAVYARHKQVLEGELARLWDEQLANQAEGLARKHVLPAMSKEIAFSQVAKEVAMGTYDQLGVRKTASAVIGDEEARTAVEAAVVKQLSDNPTLRNGLKAGAEKVWHDPAFRDDVATSVRDVLTDPALRARAGDALFEALEKTLPEMQGDLQRELEALDRRGLDLEPVFRKLLLKSGAIRPALARVLRREVLNKDRFELVVGR